MVSHIGILIHKIGWGGGVGVWGQGGGILLTWPSSTVLAGSSSRPVEQHQNCSMSDMQRSILFPIFFFIS